MNAEQFDGLIGYRFATEFPLPAATATGLEYIVAANGVFARAVRPGISVLMPITPHQQSLKGLVELEPYCQVNPRVPEAVLFTMWRLSCQAFSNSTELLEILFHLVLTDTWQLIVPEQFQSVARCSPIETDPESSTYRAAIEIHSHGTMRAFFSMEDNADESSGFRIYGVLGRVRSLKPELLLRVGLFGHCWEIPIVSVFDINPDHPDGFIQDVSQGAYYSNLVFGDVNHEPGSEL